MSKHIGRLHVLTDTALQSRFSHIELAEMAIQGGADAIQFRQKTGSVSDMLTQCFKIQNICTDTGVTFIVNDRLDVAMGVDADGVHLGQDDFPAPLARRFFGEGKIIGGSAAVLEEALKCDKDGVDYIGFGPVFPTSSKQDAGPVSGIDLLKTVVESVSVPVIAIGGITPENAPAALRAGAAGIAVISAVCCAPDPEEATRQLYLALQETGNIELK